MVENGAGKERLLILAKVTEKNPPPTEHF